MYSAFVYKLSRGVRTRSRIRRPIDVIYDLNKLMEDIVFSHN